jgi:hypothetical protein
MIRQILAVFVGMLVSVLCAAAFGYFFYTYSGRFTSVEMGRVARFAGDPIVAILVGASVGLIANSRSAGLAALSLLPSALRMISLGRLDPAHMPLLILLMLAYLAIGAFTAHVICGVRSRTRAAVLKEPSS